MIDKLIKHKNIIIVFLLTSLILVLFWNNIPSKSDAEGTAKKFIEHMLDGNAKKCTSLMHDDLIETAGYKTEKLFINAFDKTLDSITDIYKDKYGWGWDYEVTVIDSFNVDIYDSYDYKKEYTEEGSVVKVVLEVEHKGGGLFNSKEGTDTFELIMKKADGKWLVYDIIL